MNEKAWRVAAALSRIARKSGMNCPQADILIAACAKRHGADLLHRDKHLAGLMKLAT